MADTTESLPALYGSYKKNTKYVLGWLRSACPLETPIHPNTPFKSTAEILKAAEQVRSVNCAVPRSVVSALNEAITRRWRVLEIYQSLPTLSDDRDASDHQHEAFIRKLEDVLRILQPLEAKSKRAPSKLPSPIETPSSEPGSNTFGVLNDTNLLGEGKLDAVDGENIGSTSKEPETSDRSLPPSSEDILLKDDEIGEWIELSFRLCELDLICEQVNIFWKEAAEQPALIPLAALLSTTALHSVAKMSASMEAIAPTYDILISKWIAHKRKRAKISFTDIHGLEYQTGGRLADGTSLFHIGLVLEHFRTSAEYRKILPDAGKRQNPLSVIQRPTVSSCDLDDASIRLPHADDLALDQIQESMRQLLVSKRGIASLEISERDIYIIEPLLPLMSQKLRDPNAPVPIHLVFGMEILLSTYKAFLWLEGEPNKRNCRIIALHFANEVSRSMLTTTSAIDTAGEDAEPALLYDRAFLQHWIESLKEYTGEKRFDLYYQAPWTAGCHIVEILDMAFTGGLHLCCHLGYVCAVLHLYNALRRLDKPIDQILLLDQLCQVLLDPLFLGTLPRENFSSHFRRAMGQGLEKKHDSDRDASVLSSAATTSLRELNPTTLSVFCELHESRYRPTNDFWVRVYTDTAVRRPTAAQIRDVTKLVNSEPLSVALEKTRTRILPELNGELPVLRIDFFAIFRFCLQLLQDLGETVVDQHLEPEGEEKGALQGFFWTDEILNDLVERLRDDSKRSRMGHWRELNVTKTVFAKVDGTASVSDFLWSI